MNSLRELQDQLADAILHRQSAMLDQLIRDHGLAPDRRVQLYRNNVYATLTEALRSLFPVVNRLVGEEFFDYAARRYIQRYPSGSGNLHDYGARMPLFLNGLPAVAGLSYLPDVARLEWAYHEVFHAADHSSMDLEALAAVPASEQEQLRFKLHPASRLLHSAFPILRIFQTNRAETEAVETVDLRSGGDRLLVIRRGLDVEIEPLGAAEFGLLQALQDGRVLADACDHALTVDPDFNVAEILPWHVANHTLVDFRRPGQ